MPERSIRLALAAPALLTLASCATVGSMMSPYSETFSCKNSDHGQCIHPDKAYQDALAGRPSRSDPGVTRDRALLRPAKDSAGAGQTTQKERARGAQPAAPYLGYRESIYRELQGLVDAPVTPMLRPGRTIRTLILPYADRERPDRLYMPRFVYSILERPQWVVGDYLVNPVAPAPRASVLEQVREKPADAEGETPAVPAPAQEPNP